MTAPHPHREDRAPMTETTPPETEQPTAEPVSDPQPTEDTDPATDTPAEDTAAEEAPLDPILTEPTDDPATCGVTLIPSGEPGVGPTFTCQEAPHGDDLPHYDPQVGLAWILYEGGLRLGYGTRAELLASLTPPPPPVEQVDPVAALAAAVQRQRAVPDPSEADLAYADAIEATAAYLYGRDPGERLRALLEP